MSNVQRVKEVADIIEIMGERLSLQRSGANFRCLCPFHGEKSPSFFISPVLQRYRCFGCGETGDVFTFLEKFEGMSFAESLRYLADRYGIQLEEYTASPADKERERLLQLLDLSKQFYHYLLTQHKSGALAQEYVKQRGITSTSIKVFNLGAAPNDWDGLCKYLMNKKGFSAQEIVAAGMAISKNGRVYDRFRNRLMFPLTNHRGQVVGFSGRVLDSDTKEAKYINTPETSLYHKAQLLYGLSELYQPIRQAKSVIVVEGELDVISSAQAHVNNVVAIKGSAFTKDHARILRRTVDKVVLCLDADAAGQEATRRAIGIANEAGLELRVIAVTGGKDPDELARSHPSQWREITKQTVSAYQFLIDLAMQKHDGATPEGKRQIINDLAPVLGAIAHNVEKDFYVKKLAAHLQVGTNSVAADIEKFRGLGAANLQQRADSSASQDKQQGDDLLSRRQKVERYCVYLLLRLLEQDAATSKRNLAASMLQPLLVSKDISFSILGMQELVAALLTATQQLQLALAKLGADLQELAASLYLTPEHTLADPQQVWPEWQRSVLTLQGICLQEEIKKTTVELEKISSQLDANSADTNQSNNQSDSISPKQSMDDVEQREQQLLAKLLQQKRRLSEIQAKTSVSQANIA